MSQQHSWILNKGYLTDRVYHGYHETLAREEVIKNDSQKKKDWSVRLSRLHGLNSKFYGDFGTVIRLGVGEPVVKVKLIRQSNGQKNTLYGTSMVICMIIRFIAIQSRRNRGYNLILEYM